MKSQLIARHDECEILQRCYNSSESEFVVVFGRRRIGKTFLIEQFFNKKYDFKYVGAHNLRTREQLANFSKALSHYSRRKPREFANWFEAFDALAEYLGNISGDRRKVVFIDEMPWMDSKRSDFVSALENFWNGWAAGQENIMLVATGSASSWMVDKLIKNSGGLHNRITERIFLRPFTLGETEEYLQSRKIHWDRYQILQTYMLTGGVPYYLKLLDPKDSLAQNIDRLCFTDNGALRIEYDELYNAIFPTADVYTRVIELLSSRKSGLTRQEISATTRLNGSNLTHILTNLERCGFIAKRAQYGQKKNDVIYRLIDFYTIFYFHFIAGDTSLDEHWWLHHIDAGNTLAWMGLAFELICLEHHRQIKTALGIAGMATDVSTWRHKASHTNGNTSGAQIDMIIERADRIIHLCEIKFSHNKFSLTRDYEEKLRNRQWLFQEATKVKKTVVQTFITTYGLSNPEAWSIVHSEVTMDDLFASTK